MTRIDQQVIQRKQMNDMQMIPNSAAQSDSPPFTLEPGAQRIQDNLKMMQTYFDALFAPDLNASDSRIKQILDMFADNVEWLIVPTGDTLKGKATLAKLAPNHWAASPNRIKTLVNLFAGEEFACLEYRTGGTLTARADFPSISFEPTGQNYEFLCCFVFHIANGKIDRVHEYFDMETVKRQLGTAGVSHAHEEGMTNNEAEIRELIDGFVRAISAKDIDGVMSVYAADLVAFDVVPPLQYEGAEVFRKVWQGVFELFRDPIQYDIRDLRITASDDLAFSHSFSRLNGTMTDGRKSELWVRWTACFRKTNGGWRIVHTHVSVPVDLASGEAMLGLKP